MKQKKKMFSTCASGQKEIIGIKKANNFFMMLDKTIEYNFHTMLFFCL